MSQAGVPLYPAKTIAKLFNLTERRVQQLAKEGIIPKAARGKYELIGAVQGYVKYLQDRAIGQHEVSSSDMAAEKIRLIRAQADEKELQVKAMSRDMIPATEVAETWTKIVSATKARIMSMPALVAPVVVGLTDLRKTEAAIKAAALEALEDLADSEL